MDIPCLWVWSLSITALQVCLCGAWTHMCIHKVIGGGRHLRLGGYITMYNYAAAKGVWGYAEVALDKDFLA